MYKIIMSNNMFKWPQGRHLVKIILTQNLQKIIILFDRTREVPVEAHSSTAMQVAISGAAEQVRQTRQVPDQ